MNSYVSWWINAFRVEGWLYPATTKREMSRSDYSLLWQTKDDCALLGRTRWSFCLFPAMTNEGWLFPARTNVRFCKNEDEAQNFKIFDASKNSFPYKGTRFQKSLPPSRMHRVWPKVPHTCACAVKTLLKSPFLGEASRENAVFGGPFSPYVALATQTGVPFCLRKPNEFYQKRNLSGTG